MLLLALLTACIKGPAVPQAQSLAPSSNVYLRNSFDTDPSSYLGRFLPPGLTDLDESAGMPLACSKHVSWRFVDGGGVEYTEVLNVSSHVGARLGVPLVANAKAGAGGQAQVRVRYKLTGKMIAEVTDPDALADCCRAQPDQCTDRMLGEFIQGTGEVFHTASRHAGGGGNAMSPQGASGGADFSHNANWERAAAFPNPVYFAFKVTPTPYVHQAVTACPDWVKSPPTAAHGVYLVGRSNEAKNEDAARRRALNDATTQAVRAAGVPALAAVAVSPGVQAESWCVEARDGRHVAHVLAFVSHEELTRTKEAYAAMQQDMADPPALTPPSPEAPPQTQPPTRAPEPGVRPAPVGPAPITRTPPTRPSDAPAGGFNALLAQVRGTGFDSDKVKLIVSDGPKLSLTMAQAATLLGELGFSSSKMEALQALAPTIRDPQNVEQILDQFGFSSDKEKARALFR